MAEGKIRVVIAGDASPLKRALDEGAQETESFSSRVVGTLGRVGLAVGATLTAAGGVVGGFVAKAGIEFNSFQEQTLNSFEVMLRSGEKAQQFWDDLVAFAAQTPFELPGLVDSSKLLLAFGFSAEEVIPIMRKVGDAVAGLGGGPVVIDGVVRALGQMKAKGKATAEEMMQLAERGIPAWKYLADSMGVSIAEAMEHVSDGAIDADTVISAVLAGMEQDFSGLMQKQSQTWSGMLSTLKDTFEQWSGTVMAPVFDRMKSGLAKVLEFVSQPEVMEAGKQLGEKLASGLDVLVQFGSNAAKALQALITGEVQGGIFGLSENHPAIQALLRIRELAIELATNAKQQIADFFNALRGGEERESFGSKLGEGLRNTVTLIQTAVIPALQQFGNWFTTQGLPAVQGFVSTVSPLLSQVFGFLTQHLPTIVPLLVTFAGAFVGLQGATSILSGLLGPLSQVFSILRGAMSIGPLISTIVGLLGGPLTAALIAIAAIVAVAFVAWQNNWFGIRDIVSQVWSTVAPILSQIVGAIAQFIGQIVSSWQRWSSEVAPIAQKAWENIRTVISTVISVIATVITTVFSAIASFLSAHGEQIKGVLQGAWTVIRSVIEMVMGVIQGIIKTILAVIAGDWGAAWEGIKQVVSSIWDGIKGIVSGAIDIVKNTITIVLDAIKTVWSTVWEGIKSVASSIWDGIKSLVSGAIDAVKSTISTTLDSIDRTWQTVWNGIKTFVTGLWEEIKRAVSEKINDLITTVSGIKDRVTSALSGVGNWLYQTGRDLIQGLIDGIVSMVSNIISAVTNTVNSAVNAAKSALGIKSPSRVFLELGEQSAEGYLVGLESLAEHISTTFTRAVSGLEPAPVPAHGLTVNIHVDTLIAQDRATAERAAADVAYAIAEALRRRGVV